MVEAVGDLDDLVHQRIRLGILTICHESRRVEFLYLKGALGLTAGNLSRHLQLLDEASLVSIEKGYVGRRGKTWISITKEGAVALRAEVEALREIVRRVDSASEPTVAGASRSSKRRDGVHGAGFELRPATT